MNLAGGIVGFAVVLLVLGAFGACGAVATAVVDGQWPAWGYVVIPAALIGATLIGLYGGAA